MKGRKREPLDNAYDTMAAGKEEGYVGSRHGRSTNSDRKPTAWQFHISHHIEQKKTWNRQASWILKGAHIAWIKTLDGKVKLVHQYTKMKIFQGCTFWYHWTRKGSGSWPIARCMGRWPVLCVYILHSPPIRIQVLYKMQMFVNLRPILIEILKFANLQYSKTLS